MITWNRVDRFIESCNAAQGVIAVDLNVQGVIGLSSHQVTFAKMFPESFTVYQELVMDGMLSPGECVWNTEDGFVIAMLITQCNVIGALKDKEEEVFVYTERAIQELVNTTTDENITCPLINRGAMHKDFLNIIARVGKQLDWTIYVC